MSLDIYNTLSSAFAKEETTLKRDGRRSVGPITPASRPTILMSGFPITLNPKEYADPLSTANPNGNLISLWRFRQLVDPIPMFDTVYLPSSRSLEMSYTQIINGAVSEDENSFASMVISDANKALATQTFANMDGTPGNWRPVYAVPDDWYSIQKIKTEKQLTVDLSEVEGNVSGNIPENPMVWKIINPDQSTGEIPLDTKSKICSANVNYLMVSLNRPWFNSMIFETAGWYLKGQKAGFCSSGQNDGTGVIPMIPSSIIIGTDVTIQAEWSEKDMQVISNAQELNQQLSLGPLLINAGQNATQIHIIGWVMSQISFSPQING
jgi:hypothetical protein